MMTVTNAPGGRRRGKGAPGTVNRLPSGRERRPALAALAVLLIAGGAVLAGWLALRESHTKDYVALSRPIGRAVEIQRDDLSRVALPADTDNVIGWDDLDVVVGAYASVPLAEGSILTGAMLTDEASAPAGEAIVALQLPAGYASPDIDVGDMITVRRGDDDGTTYDAVAEVRRVRDGGSTASGDQLIDVFMSTDCADDFQRASSQKEVSVTISSDEDELTVTCKPSTSGTGETEPTKSKPSGG